ncbi:MAG: formimidoylglutamate deiminase, partial [Myxococcales bacterium]|nr:formimidoylglutamate deiminase [Myxococcales bacterium]
NLHSHAFQRAFAGETEQSAGNGKDSFWSWREAMYRFAERLDPDAVEAIAEQVFLEMLEAGYTSVAEFHYVHHASDGEPYADLAELGRRVAAAARSVGIRLTLLPVFYEAAGFGPKPIEAGQRRFYNSPERYLDLWQALEREQDGLVSLGAAPHSLRAAPLGSLNAVVREVKRRAPEAPIHIHIAEQLREVEECLAHHQRRPVELLLEGAAVDKTWCLVHATHLSSTEQVALGGAGVVAGLCPTTEANLGDGIFPLGNFRQHSGRWGIGSDSQITLDPAQELRLLEYTQRLSLHARNTVLSGDEAGHSGMRLLSEALLGGAQALGSPVGRLLPNCPADLICLDPAHPSLLGRDPETQVDSWIFASNRPAVARVMVNGQWCVTEGRHDRRETVQRRFANCLRRLTG